MGTKRTMGFIPRRLALNGNRRNQRIKLWLLGQDSNLQPSGYKRPGISSRLGLSLHPSRTIGLRVPGASAGQCLSGVRARALVSAPSPSRRDEAWLRITFLRLRRREGFPEFTRFFNHDFSWKLHIYSHPLCRLSYRGASGRNISRDRQKSKNIGDQKTQILQNR